MEGSLHSAWHIPATKILSVVIMIFHQQKSLSSIFALWPAFLPNIPWLFWMRFMFSGQLTLKENSGISKIKPCKMVTQHFVPNISLCLHMHTCPSRAERATFVVSFQRVYVNKMTEFNEKFASFCISHKDSSTIHILDTQAHTVIHHTVCLC